MTETVTQGRVTKRKPKRDRAHLVADDIVSANGLATHLGMSRQNVALRAKVRWLLRPDRQPAALHQAPARAASAHAALAGRRRSRQGQDGDAATEADGEEARTGAAG